MRSSAALVASLLSSDAREDDIVDVATRLAPFDHILDPEDTRFSSEKGKSLLRLAIERAGPMSLASLDAIASSHVAGADVAWLLSNPTSASQPSLLDHLAMRIPMSDRGSQKTSKDLVMRALEISSLDQISRADSFGHSLSRALLDQSGRADFGIEPFIALVQRQGKTMATARLPDGRPAVLAARCPEAFEAFLAAGGDPRQKVGEKKEPLWEALREQARRMSGSSTLAQAVDAWAKTHESDKESAREIHQYFDQLSKYGGEEKLKTRKDWTTLRDENGRTTLMAVCLGRATAIKSFWSVKKANATAGLFDHEGRGLWHAVLTHGKDAPTSTAAYLAEHAPVQPDAQGRGLLPSLWAMRNPQGHMSSEHEWLFNTPELGRACTFAPLAGSWLGCENPSEAQDFAHWLANERYLGSSTSFSKYSNSRSVEILAFLAMSLDDASFAQIPKAISGAMAYNLALDRFNHFRIEQIDEKIAAILSHGGHVELTAERQETLIQRARPESARLIQAAFGAAKERKELEGSLGDADAPIQPSARRGRI
jgi:hypothetical protein